MKKIVFIIFIFGLYCSSTYSQTSDNISIKDIRRHVDNLATTLKSDNQLDNKYINIDDNGER